MSGEGVLYGLILKGLNLGLNPQRTVFYGRVRYKWVLMAISDHDNDLRVSLS